MRCAAVAQGAALRDHRHLIDVAAVVPAGEVHDLHPAAGGSHQPDAVFATLEAVVPGDLGDGAGDDRGGSPLARLPGQSSLGRHSASYG